MGGKKGGTLEGLNRGQSARPDLPPRRLLPPPPSPRPPNLRASDGREETAQPIRFVGFHRRVQDALERGHGGKAGAEARRAPPGGMGPPTSGHLPESIS